MPASTNLAYRMWRDVPHNNLPRLLIPRVANSCAFAPFTAVALLSGAIFPAAVNENRPAFVATPVLRAFARPVGIGGDRLVFQAQRITRSN
jgi:hypothetical protein